MADQSEQESVNAMQDELPASDSAQAAELANFVSQASEKYVRKQYNEAAELYSQALDIQTELNGEMNPANAELLYHYGRTLFQLGVSKSDVLGEKVAGDAKKKQKDDSNSKKRKRAASASETGPSKLSKTQDDPVAEAAVEKIVEGKDSLKSQEETTKARPLFQISGDGDDWDDDSDADSDEAAGEDDDDEDDLATAYEILDVARVLYLKRIEENDAQSKQQKEQLADVYDLQAEICLENERFQDAIKDAEASLELKKALYEPHQGIVAEAHFKLSLALEFASVTVQRDDNNVPIEGADQQVDEELRTQAAEQMDAAVACTKLRIEKLEQKPVGETTDQDIKELREILADMETRLQDLKNPAIAVNQALNAAMAPAGAAGDNAPLGGILGTILGETPAAQKARIEEAAKGATDLSGLVKRKPKKGETSSSGFPSASAEPKAPTSESKNGASP